MTIEKVSQESGSTKKANHLLGESSPYLFEHLYNPVDWHPYSDTTFQKALDERKLIFLSIGYSACHWCHVMARESFENEKIAQLLNADFISIKVDKEERPDLDQIYQYAVQMLGGNGGWPLSVFLTPDRKIIFGGTYFPPEPRYGMISFSELLVKIKKLFQEHKKDIYDSHEEIMGALRTTFSGSPDDTTVSENPLSPKFGPKVFEGVVSYYLQKIDPVNGGFGSAPKFPNFPAIIFLLHQYAETRINIPHDPLVTLLSDSVKLNIKNAIEITLDHMAAGGIYDHVGGGFARYSVDEHWLVPHFEKMLYDNAMALVAYSEAYRVFKKPRYKEIVKETIEWAIREMYEQDRGFYATQDADSDGVEGRFYVWTLAKLQTIIPQENHNLFFNAYGVTEEGNFEDGKNILHLTRDYEALAIKHDSTPKMIQKKLSDIRKQLFSIRKLRVPPHKDEKILTAWNALWTHGLFAAYGLFVDEPFGQQIKEIALKTNQFLLEHLFEASKRQLYHSFQKNERKIIGNLDDYAYLIQSLFDQFNITHEISIFETIEKLISNVNDKFWDSHLKLFYYTTNDIQDIPVRPTIDMDMPLPSPTAVMTENIIQLYYLTNETQLRKQAEQVLFKEFKHVFQHPLEHASFWLALEWLFYGPIDIAVLKPTQIDKTHSLDLFSKFYIPRLHLYEGHEPDSRLTAFYGKILKEKTVIYTLCLHSNCLTPAEDYKQFDDLLSKHFIQ